MNDIITFEDRKALLNADGSINLVNADGQPVVITDKTKALALANIKFACAMAKGLDKALCYEMAQLTEKMASDFGFASLTQLVKYNFPDVQESNISRNRRVGKMFTQKAFNENGTVSYIWRTPIPDGATVTNLGEVLPLLGIKDWAKLDDFTEEEISETVNNFVDMYLTVHDGENDSKLHLLAPLTKLREEKKALLPDTGKKSKKPEKKPENTPENKPEESAPTLTINEQAKAHIDALQEYFKGNTSALKHLASLLNFVAKEIEVEQAQAQAQNNEQ